MQTTKLYVQLYENNRPVWKKKNSLSQPPPPSPEIPRPLTPPPLRNFQSLPWRGVWIFSGTTQLIFEHAFKLILATIQGTDFSMSSDLLIIVYFPINESGNHSAL